MVRNYLSLVKFSHTIFALPFAMIGFFLAVFYSGYVLSWKLLGLVILCMIFARSAAMAFNRYADRFIDSENERTKVREIPSGIITPKAALIFVIISCILFVITTYYINTICFLLSPVALLIVLGYSYTKRFTAYAHFVLGIGLALAPIGAYLAVTAQFALLPVLFSFVVLFWVGGFDIIYALQDDHFDKEKGLHSIPAKLGRSKALLVSNIAHLICGTLVLAIGYLAHFGLLYWTGALIFIFLLAYQHKLVKPYDLSKVNLAFFTTNGIASVVFSVFVIADLIVRTLWAGY